MFPLTRNWSPWQELDGLRQEMNRIFSGAQLPERSFGGEYPPINAWRSENGIALTAELPGVDLDDLDLSVTARTVTIAGKPHVEQEREGCQIQRRERSTERFSRTLELPFDVDPQSAEAVYDKGVLVLKLFRPKSHQPKKVAIKQA